MRSDEHTHINHTHTAKAGSSSGESPFAQASHSPAGEGSTSSKNHQAREQARQSTRWMPRRSRPMKDAETGETFRGSCMQAMSPETPNGATPPE